MTHMNRRSGFSLSEVLISLFIASLLMTTLFQFYLSNKQQYQNVQNMLDSGMEVQWVSEMIKDSVRRAGFTPCLGVDQLRIVDRRRTTQNMEALVVAPSPLQSIQVNRMSDSFNTIIKIHSSIEIEIPRESRINERMSILIADCHHAEIHQIYRVDPLKHSVLVTLTKPLVFAYHFPVYLGEWIEETWSIQSNKKGIKVLFYQLAQREELTDLIHSFHIKRYSIKGKQLLSIVLGLDKDKSHQFVVAVRGS